MSFGGSGPGADAGRPDSGQQARVLISVDGLSKEYASRTGPISALESLDFTISEHEFVSVIGPSGCGKSTLIRLMVGLAAPDAGEVRFGGAALTAASAPALRRRMGYVIQDGGLFPHMRARDNVTVMARHLGWDRARIDARLADLARLTAFPEDGLGRYPAQLSGGQRQRVSLMRALMLEPDVLLLDEPLGALDPMIRFELQGELRDIFQSLGKTVVLVTHDIGEAGYFGDTIVLMRDGAIVQAGTIAELIDRPAEPFVERFITAQRGLIQALEERR